MFFRKPFFVGYNLSDRSLASLAGCFFPPTNAASRAAAIIRFLRERPAISGAQEWIARLVPINDRLIAFKQAHPDLLYWLEVVLYQGNSAAGLSLDNDTLRFLGEIGATVDCDIYRK